MLLEYTSKRYVTCDPDTDKPEPDTVDSPAYVLLNQIIGLIEDMTDHGPDRVVTLVLLRSGHTLTAEEPVSEFRDALKFATRHIAAGPGIVDRTSGESEELYPWQRCEKVSELAKKWRAHETKPRQSSVPVYGPSEPDPTRDEHGGRVVTVPVPPAPPEADNVTDDPLMHGHAVQTVAGVALFPAGSTPEEGQAAFDKLMGHLEADPRGIGRFQEPPAVDPDDKPKDPDGDQDQGD